MSHKADAQKLAGILRGKELRVAGAVHPDLVRFDPDLHGGVVVDHSLNDPRLRPLMTDYHLIPSGPRHTIVVRRQQL